ncbi:MAG: glycerol-3-phosphate dehydrogenase, partial [Mycobacterium sp.]|nr:glycerol-3-phosphate dehydrogenase [Mycobacterium sp.]
MTGSTALNETRRAAELAALADGEPLDVIVIGGGITGTGIALDAATRGLRVALVEKHDLAFGT